MFSYNRPNRKTTFWIDSGDRNDSGDYMRTSLKTYVGNNRGVRSVVSSIFAWTILPCSTKCLPFQPWLFNAVDLIGFRFGSRESRGIRIPCLWNCSNKQQKPLNLLKSPPASKLVEQVVEFCLFVQSTKGIFICRRHCVLGCLAHSGFKLSELHPQTIEKLHWQLSCDFVDFDTFCLVSKSRDFIGARKINYFILIVLKNTWSPKNTVRNLVGLVHIFISHSFLYSVHFDYGKLLALIFSLFVVPTWNFWDFYH